MPSSWSSPRNFRQKNFREITKLLLLCKLSPVLRQIKSMFLVICLTLLQFDHFSSKIQFFQVGQFLAISETLNCGIWQIWFHVKSEWRWNVQISTKSCLDFTFWKFFWFIVDLSWNLWKLVKEQELPKRQHIGADRMFLSNQLKYDQNTTKLRV